MAINPEEIRWASNDDTDPLTNGPNKVEPTSEFKNSGLKGSEPYAMEHINYQWDKAHEFFVDIQSQLDALVLDAGSALLQQVYHVGSLYTSFDPQSPAVRYGFGTWTRIQGRFLVGVDDADTDFDGAGETGGAKNHSHTDTFGIADHILTEAQLPPHTHTYRDTLNFEKASFVTAVPSASKVFLGNVAGGSGSGDSDTDNDTSVFVDNNTESTGSGLGHSHAKTGGINSSSNLPPYTAVYMWRRTA